MVLASDVGSHGRVSLLEGYIGKGSDDRGQEGKSGGIGENIYLERRVRFTLSANPFIVISQKKRREKKRGWFDSSMVRC